MKGAGGSGPGCRDTDRGGSRPDAGSALWLAGCVIALIACSTLPDHAAPRGGIVDPAEVDLSDTIAYRPLTRADFKAEAPPASFPAHAGRIGAATCAYILTTPDTRIRMQPAGGGNAYRAAFERLGFHARMDRRCSWWNPKDVGLPRDYVLEHEQIHFALFELEARRMEASVPELRSRLRATAPSAEEAGRQVEARLREHIRERIDAVVARSREFDEDTSMGHRPEAQRRWWERVRSELAATAPARR